MIIQSTTAASKSAQNIALKLLKLGSDPILTLAKPYQKSFAMITILEFPSSISIVMRYKSV